MELEKRLLLLGTGVFQAEFPRKVEAVTVPNDDGTFTVIINSALSPCKQRAALEHELNHIEQDHFYKDYEAIQEIEAEADALA